MQQSRPVQRPATSGASIYPYMRRLLVVSFLFGLALVPQALAKGPIELCGPDACAQAFDEGPGLARLLGTTAPPTQVTMPPASPYYVVRFRDMGSQPLGFWIPAAGVFRETDAFNRTAMWTRPDADTAAAIAQASSGIAPYVPRANTVQIGGRTVARPRGWITLFGIGTPTTVVPNPHAWVPIWMWAREQSPWADGLTMIWISYSGPYLLRDGHVLQIPQRVASRVRHALPLSG
jgi:hypothetical protein